MSTRIYNINDHFFDVINTQEKAYILGFFMADACNYEDTGVVKIDLSECDKYMLDKMANIMEYTGEIKQYNSDTKKTFLGYDGKIFECQPMARFLFRSKHISQKLAEYGCIKHKSEKGEFIKEGIVPNELFNHYIRGLIDGNGGISYWEDNPNTHHLKFQINFSGTVDIVNNLAKYFSEKFNCCPAIRDRWPDRNNNNLQFNICGNIIVEKILDWLYDDATIYLTRKFEKYSTLKKERCRVLNDKKLYGSVYPRRKVINLSTLEIFESVTKASRSIEVSPSVITNKCKKQNGWMYLDDYNKLEKVANY